MKISQSLIKEVLKNDHCPKQIMYSFIEGKDLIEPSENMLLGRYFETGLLGSCRGGEVQEPRMIKTGKAKPFLDCDDLVEFAKEVFVKLGLDISKGSSQLDVETELLKGAIDHRNKDLIDSSKLANYDVKWTATKEDDRWNGWGNPEEKEDAKLQAAHYTLLSYEETGLWMPFYFLVFGKDKWVKVIRYQFTDDAILNHQSKIHHTALKIREYSETNYKGNGTFNKCLACPFYNECEDKATLPEIETYQI